MSGRQFVDTLSQLGYEKAGRLDPQGLDWMFEHEALLPFLEWFCNNLNAANVIQQKDLEEYKTIANSSSGVLEGPQLEEALKNLRTTQDEFVTEEDLRQDIEELNSDLRTYKERKQNLMQKRNRLSVHHTAMAHRLSKLNSTEAKVKSQYKKSMEQSQTDNTEMNGCLHNLVESVGQLNSVYKLPIKEQSPSTIPMFLSQVSLDDYTENESKFSQELSAFTKKQFFEGIADIAGQTESSQYEILEISDPNSLLIKGENQGNYMNQCKELARIQVSYPNAKSKYIDAKLMSCHIERCVQTVEDILQSIQKGQFSKDINKIRQRHQDVKSALQVVHHDFGNIVKGDIPALIEESTALQVSKILTGDYNLKLARQDYFIANQDQVIHHLVQQRSRNEFLTMAFEVENCSHRDVHRLLTGVRQQLQRHLKSWQDRMKLMDDPLLTPAKYNRGTIDSRDTSTVRLHNILATAKEENQEKHIFLTYSGLVEGAEKLRQSHAALQNCAVTTLSKEEDRLKLLESNLAVCEEMVYSGSSTTSGQPSLTPPQLMASITQLDSTLKKLEHSIKDIVKDIEYKKQVLKNDPLMYKERRLFVYFFSNPVRLKQLCSEMISRLQAQKLM